MPRRATCKNGHTFWEIRSKRRPCPKCGSINRLVSVAAKDRLTAIDRT